MSSADAARWNARYRDEVRDSFVRPRPFLRENAPLLPRGGLALDAAMGLGGNAGFLLERGLRVLGIDISDVAVQEAKARWPGLMAVIGDLTAFPLPPETFDAIINFYYLQRELWPVYVKALKPGGILIYETLTREMAAIHPEIEPAFLLAPGELASAFGELETLAYREGWADSGSHHPRAVASLVARKPTGSR